MCMIIAKEKGVEIPEKMNDYIDYSYSSNNDGMGIALWKKDSNFVLIKKDFKKLKKLKRFVKNNVDKEDALIIHLRAASAGNKSFTNRHPFSLELKKINELECKTSMAVAHNGTFINLKEANSKFSDTYVFVRDILSDPIIKNNLERTSIALLLEKFIGRSRLVILNSKGEFSYYGDWEEEDGLKFSNSGYKKRNVFSEEGYWNWYSNYYLNNKIRKEPYFCERCNRFAPLKYIEGEWICEDCKKLKELGKKEEILKIEDKKDNVKEEVEEWICEFCRDKTDVLYNLEGLYMCKKCYDYFNREVR